MFGTAIMYMAVGMITYSLVVFIHLISAQMQGYSAFEYWEVALPEIETRLTPLVFLWSIIIWPIRLWRLIAIIPTLYDVYDWRKYGPRRRKGWL